MCDVNPHVHMRIHMYMHMHMCAIGEARRRALPAWRTAAHHKRALLFLPLAAALALGPPLVPLEPLAGGLAGLALGGFADAGGAGAGAVGMDASGALAGTGTHGAAFS